MAGSVVTSLRLLSYYIICKRVSCTAACSEFTCCQRSLRVKQGGETVLYSGTVMSGLIFLSLSRQLDICFSAYRAGFSNISTYNRIDKKSQCCYVFKTLCISNDHSMLTARRQPRSAAASCQQQYLEIIISS